MSPPPPLATGLQKILSHSPCVMRLMYGAKSAYVLSLIRSRNSSRLVTSANRCSFPNSLSLLVLSSFNSSRSCVSRTCFVARSKLEDDRFPKAIMNRMKMYCKTRVPSECDSAGFFRAISTKITIASTRKARSPPARKKIILFKYKHS